VRNRCRRPKLSPLHSPHIGESGNLTCEHSHRRSSAPHLTLYRELAKGKAVDGDRLARALGVSSAEGRALLQREAIKRSVYPDGEGRVLGFGGLSAKPMHHRFDVKGTTLWTWCALDSLFIPGILGCPARVTSPDPETRQLVRLIVTPDGIESVDPKAAVISLVELDAGTFGASAINAMARFCHFVFFFASRSSGARWVGRNPGTFLYSLDDAFVLGKRLIARRFGTELARPVMAPASSAQQSGPDR
jgi:alkylmercury lyase